MKTLIMLVVAGGLYAADGTTVGSFGKPPVKFKSQNKFRAVTNVNKRGNKAIQFNIKS